MVSQGLEIPGYRLALCVCLYRHDYTNPQAIVKVNRTRSESPGLASGDRMIIIELHLGVIELETRAR
jgi:hypothetical protein